MSTVPLKKSPFNCITLPEDALAANFVTLALYSIQESRPESIPGLSIERIKWEATETGEEIENDVGNVTNCRAHLPDDFDWVLDIGSDGRSFGGFPRQIGFLVSYVLKRRREISKNRKYRQISGKSQSSASKYH